MSNITKHQKKFRDQIEDLENSLLQSNDGRIAKGNSDMFPLKHYFVEGLYIREMFIKKNSFFSTSLAGTKKVGHALEDSVFINIHPNVSNEKNIDKVEKNIVVENYKNYNKFLVSNNKNKLKN